MRISRKLSKNHLLNSNWKVIGVSEILAPVHDLIINDEQHFGIWWHRRWPTTPIVLQ
ncbi:unnamed protein product [Haemonchus placei]|uniref:Uncharacterized protein n=1 Tax=Haemonchus placei TaxID=6290 RepID=A0A0N4VWS1_HAEPC|nr:unnamed protein product [Haemonchus placei]